MWGLSQKIVANRRGFSDSDTNGRLATTYVDTLRDRLYRLVHEPDCHPDALPSPPCLALGPL